MMEDVGGRVAGFEKLQTAHTMNALGAQWKADIRCGHLFEI